MTFNPATPFNGIEFCPEHTGPAFKKDCPACEEEYTKRDEALVAQGNQARLLSETLAENGLTMPPEVIMQIRLETLLDALFQVRDRMMFEAQCGGKIIAQMKGAIKSAKAESGIAVPNGAKVVRPNNIRSLKKR